MIDQAEIGAALGSGDVELIALIEHNHRAELESETVSIQASIRSSLKDLIDGGACDSEPAPSYVRAFAMLCQELGEPLSTCTVLGAVREAFRDVPFDVPTEPGVATVQLLSCSDAWALIAKLEGSPSELEPEVTKWLQSAVTQHKSILLFSTSLTV